MYENCRIVVGDRPLSARLKTWLIYAYMRYWASLSQYLMKMFKRHIWLCIQHGTCLGYLLAEWWPRWVLRIYGIGKWAINYPAWSGLDLKVVYSFYYLFGSPLFTYRTHKWFGGTGVMTPGHDLTDPLWGKPERPKYEESFDAILNRMLHKPFGCWWFVTPQHVMSLPWISHQQDAGNINIPVFVTYCFHAGSNELVAYQITLWMTLNDSTLRLLVQTS